MASNVKSTSSFPAIAEIGARPQHRLRFSRQQEVRKKKPRNVMGESSHPTGAESSVGYWLQARKFGAALSHRALHQRRTAVLTFSVGGVALNASIIAKE
jgi:hypothetical protein